MAVPGATRVLANYGATVIRLVGADVVTPRSPQKPCAPGDLTTHPCGRSKPDLIFLAPALLDYTVNRRTQARVGNHDPQRAPHGVYPAAGEDRWVAIVVDSNQQWESLCRVMQRPDLAADQRLAGLAQTA
ncbi:hypothetical protein NKDENANG_00062 [Candidatus Entotheonellaceae bacterium PAL068K]